MTYEDSVALMLGYLLWKNGKLTEEQEKKLVENFSKKVEKMLDKSNQM